MRYLALPLWSWSYSMYCMYVLHTLYSLWTILHTHFPWIHLITLQVRSHSGLCALLDIPNYVRANGADSLKAKLHGLVSNPPSNPVPASEPKLNKMDQPGPHWLLWVGMCTLAWREEGGQECIADPRDFHVDDVLKLDLNEFNCFTLIRCVWN